jgi:hypothetical protein
LRVGFGGSSLEPEAIEDSMQRIYLKKLALAQAIANPRKILNRL